ncbi:MAG: hypothetical protein WBA67_06435, partial [Jannaschia sp.]
PLPANEWTELTGGDVSEITFQNKGKYPFEVLGTVGSVPPAASAVGFGYSVGLGEINRPLSDLFRGIPGANRVWARSEGVDGSALVDHA